MLTAHTRDLCTHCVRDGQQRFDLRLLSCRGLSEVHQRLIVSREEYLRQGGGVRV